MQAKRPEKREGSETSCASSATMGLHYRRKSREDQGCQVDIGDERIGVWTLPDYGTVYLTMLFFPPLNYLQRDKNISSYVRILAQPQ